MKEVKNLLGMERKRWRIYWMWNSLLQRPDVRDERLHLIARQMLALVSRGRQRADAGGDDVGKIGIAASLHRVAPEIRDVVFLSDRRVAAGVGAVTGDALLGLEDRLPRGDQRRV